MTYDERRKTLKELAFIDEADSYETDESGIYLDENLGRFYLITASGCSCWDGEYDEEEHDSFASLRDSLLNKDRRYNPSLSGAQALLDTAIAKLTQMYSLASNLVS